MRFGDEKLGMPTPRCDNHRASAARGVATSLFPLAARALHQVCRQGGQSVRLSNNIDYAHRDLANFACQDSAAARAYRRMPLAGDVGENIDLANSEPSHSNAIVLSNATALYPHTLTSGPESGLCNQLMALVGYVLLMSYTKRFSALILPDFTSHDQGGVNEPFARLFDPGPMIQSLAAVGIVARAQPLPGERVLRPRAMNGWWAYKKWVHNGPHPRPLQRFEDALYRGLQPSAGIRRRVRLVQAELGLQPGAYGCVHARIEIDVKRSWPVMQTGPPALLGDYYDALAQAEPELNGVKRIFAAVGAAITAQEREELDSRSTSWGAPLARSTQGKSYHRGKRNVSAPSYAGAALVDFSVCREANWLAGWSGTLTLTLALAQP